jgi:hypothetical protein
VKYKVKQDYAELRRNDYPDIGDQLDALWKGGADLEAMRQKILGVKSKYPKPGDGQSNEPSTT